MTKARRDRAACHSPSQMVGIGAANANWLSRRRLLLGGWLRRRVLVALVFLEQALQQGDGIEEWIVELEEQVDVVEVFLAAEAVGQVVLRVDGGPHFAAVRAQEAEVASAHFRGRTVAAQSADGVRHRQIVAQAAQEVLGKHGGTPRLMGKPCDSAMSIIQKSVRSASFCQCGCKRTRLTLPTSMVLLAERTASIRQPTHRLRAWRSTPPVLRTIRSTAGCVKVLWPRPARSSSRRMKSRMASGPRRLVMTE